MSVVYVTQPTVFFTSQIDFPQPVAMVGPQKFINQDTPPPLTYPSNAFIFLPLHAFTIPLQNS
jgi:hypothetical protein